MKKVITALTATAALSTYGLADQVEASSYTVQGGDTLWKIANQNNVSVGQLKSWNSLSSDMIYINQKLTVESSSSNSSSSSSNSSSSSSTSTTTSSSGSYTVKPGDTLSKIASAHGMNYRTLMKNNNISSHIIYPGQKLSVDGSSKSSSNSSNSSSSNTSNSNSTSSSDSSTRSTGTYTVKSGDTLSKIANKHGTTYRKIMNLNNLSSTVIYVGQKLSVSGSSSSVSEPDSNDNTSVTDKVSAPAPSGTSYGTNYYYWGDCTWYVFERRKQLGKPVGNNWGNAYDWDNGARSEGYSVNNSPSVGAIMQTEAWTNYAWSFGHVAVVERINADGSVLVSEMNFGSGKGVKNFRTISSSQVSSHTFIH
ncbi:LysM peptidoglycan-binding domain-containing protein [Salinicoccus jeotgali]